MNDFDLNKITGNEPPLITEDDKDAEIERLHRACEYNNTRAAACEDELQRKEAEIERLRDQVQIRAGHVLDLEQTVKQREEEIERLRALISYTNASVGRSMRDLWTAVREPDKSGMSVDHALGHLAQSLAPLRAEAVERG